MKSIFYILCIASISFILTSCNDSQPNNESNTTVQNAKVQTVQNSSQSKIEFKDIVKILNADGIQYQIIKANKEIKLNVTSTQNSKYSDWTPAKLYSYLLGEDFTIVSSAIENNADGDFHYESKNLKFNTMDQKMTGGTYTITSKL